MVEPRGGATARPRRAIRSFVLRGGRTTHAQLRALEELWPVYGLAHEAGADAIPFDLDAVFGRRAPRLLEIGFGTGDALLSHAMAHPDVDCLGIEVHRAGVGHLLLAAETAGVRNLRILCADAVEMLAHHLPAASFDTVHLFFPDPWPKKRHHKRRIVQAAFADLIERVLRPGGELCCATDWQPYAEHMLEVLDAASGLRNAGTPYVPRPMSRALTRFERRGKRLGHVVRDLRYVRI